VLPPGALVLTGSSLGSPPFRELVEAAAAGGFAGLSLWPAASYQRARAEGLADADLRALLADHGLAVADVDARVAWVGPGDPGPPYREEPSERELFDAAEALGASACNAIASSWKRQTLLNIVKLRYADTPVFLDVGQIISGYQLEGTVGVQGTLNSASALGDIVELGTAGRYTDRPTITYTPLTGAHFIQVLMTPIPPPALFMLVESGVAVDLLLQVAVQEINGISNRRGGLRSRAADPDFPRLLDAMRRVQDSGAIALRVERSEGSKAEGTVMTIRREALPPEVQADAALIRSLLRLRADQDEFRVVYGAQARAAEEVAVQTRSAFQIMSQLGGDVEVPAEHLAEQRTYPSPPPAVPGDPALPPMVRIRSATEVPDDAFTAVRYRDHWYWIDDRDIRSKSIFTFLMILTTLAEKGGHVQPPVVTIQGN